MARPSDLSERVCKHKGIKQENLHRNSFFPYRYSAILLKNIVKEPEGVAQMCSVKQFFLEISQNSQENTCARALMITISSVKFY